jgi:hypothetical protein
MSELSPRGQALLRASRAALRPSGGDKERILTGLRERLGMPLAGGAAHAAAHSSRLLWTVGAAAVIGVAGVVAMSVSSGKPPATPPVVPALVSAAPVVAATPSPAEPAAAPAPASSATPAAPSVAMRRSDRLAEEVAILSQAAKALRAGRAADALGALNEHQRKFPSGLLAQERRAARAEALCSLGRFGEAHSELATLVRTAPQSPLTVRAQERCKARSTKSP